VSKSLSFSLRQCAIALPLSALLLLLGCNKQDGTPPKTEHAKQAATAAPQVSADGLPASALTVVSLPMGFKRDTGDLDVMVKRRQIRALVIINPIGFFYDKGMPKGIMYETLAAFQKFVNQKLKTGKLPITVTFIPMRADQIAKALTEGMGDLIAYGLVVTPEREKLVAFSTPLMTDVKQIIVTGSDLGSISTLADLGGKEVYVNPISTYYQNLQLANETLKKSGKIPILIKAADKNLTDDDLVQMVNAGLIPATVTIQQRADLWSQVLPNVHAHPDLVIASGQSLAWAMRKNNPQFKRLVDEFVGTNAAGKSFGNTLLRRYLQNTKWVKNSTSSSEMKKFQQNVAFMQKYAGQYDFDFLMIAAQAYQESLLDQSKRNPSGAVGIMQVIPKNEDIFELRSLDAVFRLKWGIAAMIAGQSYNFRIRHGPKFFQFLKGQRDLFAAAWIELV
jgi:membrane-bound lytic murein transglycosylase MltF